MSTDLAILVPVLRRPHRVVPLLESIKAATPRARVLFIADPDDEAELEAVTEAMRDEWPMTVTLERHAGTYAEKINHAVGRTTAALLFLGADDLRFIPGWYEAATARLGPAQVVGVNDCLDRKRRPQHATHFLVTRAYANRPTIDDQRGPLSEAYTHGFTDDELISTAMRRGVYVYAPEALVEHRHPMGGKAPDDPVYRKGRKSHRADRAVFRRRSRLWR